MLTSRTGVAEEVSLIRIINCSVIQWQYTNEATLPYLSRVFLLCPWQFLLLIQLKRENPLK